MYMAKKERKTPERKLTLKQEMFCQYYMDCEGNASEAYRMAYNTENMADESIWTNACKLKNDAKVAQRIEELKAKLIAESVVSRERVEAALLDIVLANVSDLYIEDPDTGKIKMRTPSQLPKRVKNAIKTMTNSRGNVRYDFHSKTEAARLLGEWNGWKATQNVNINGGLNLGDEFTIGGLEDYYND